MPISMAPIGKEMCVVKVLTDEKTKKHLANLGITIDSSITVISEQNGGVICLVKEGRLALDNELSRKILVAQKR
ncbi:MAG: ferrous iron transport protein A [Clostridia bacterium]|nr:ferrous iron transport protein A [Clostridia bacterium]